MFLSIKSKAVEGSDNPAPGIHDLHIQERL